MENKSANRVMLEFFHDSDKEAFHALQLLILRGYTPDMLKDRAQLIVREYEERREESRKEFK